MLFYTLFDFLFVFSVLYKSKQNFKLNFNVIAENVGRLQVTPIYTPPYNI